MIYQCCDEKRKAAVLGNPALNGIDYLEVLGFDAQPLGLEPQTILLVRCLKAAPATVTPDNIVISGGESVTEIKAVWLATASAPPASLTPAQQNYFKSLPDVANLLLIGTSSAGDFSPYTLRLVNSVVQALEDPFAVTEVLAGFDPQLAEVEFSFKVECPPYFDCAPPPADCPPELPAPPQINYLAKDYGSFRTVILDRLSQLLPAWNATSEADMGIALAELIAYVGDSLSYKQDAVATEAYLQTARSRISLRRHARLVDYRVHDGCNARAWMHLLVSAQVLLDHTQTRFYTSAPGMPSSLKVGSGNERAALAAGVIAFEPMWDLQLFPEHNQMSFYTWGDKNCCLPKGATEATLLGTFPDLQPGDVLIFQEMLGPQTGNPADADVRHRCAVRLTRVTTQDGQGHPLVDPLFEDGTGAPITSGSQKPTPVTEIQWSSEDALPFPVCLSSKFLDSTGKEQNLINVSVVFGNVVLADHGLSLTGIDLGIVPRPSIFYPRNQADRCHPANPVPVQVRFRPALPDSPITQAVALAPSRPSAWELTHYDANQAIPAIGLNSVLHSAIPWTPEQDLLTDSPMDTHFVVEVEFDGTARLRFGDGVNGLRPESDSVFTASYRVGNGTAGNVGSDTLTFFAGDPRVYACSNPLPATGGTDPETPEQIRRRAPQAFLTQERAVTMADYEHVAEMNAQVENAVATLRWTGSWYTVFITGEPRGGGNLTASLRKALKKNINRYRLAGQDIELESPQYVSLEIELVVCVDPNYFQKDVEQSLFQVLGNQLLPNGQKGVFYPDNFTFGQTVYLSPVYAAARKVAGVQSVVATTFQRQGIPSTIYLSKGEIPLGTFQIARMENDRSFPDHGKLTLVMQGGK